MAAINLLVLKRLRELTTSKKPWAIPIIDKFQFFKAISLIDKLSPINFFDKCCDKFSMVLTKFFCESRRKNVFLDFSGNREQFMDSAVALNKTKRDVFKLQ